MTKKGYFRTEFAMEKGTIAMPVSGMFWPLKSTSLNELFGYTVSPRAKAEEMSEAFAPLSKVALIFLLLTETVMVTGPLLHVEL
jgi:hypothetical protein